MKTKNPFPFRPLIQAMVLIALTLMNVALASTTVILKQTVLIRTVVSLASVILVTLEMVSLALTLTNVVLASTTVGQTRLVKTLPVALLALATLDSEVNTFTWKSSSRSGVDMTVGFIRFSLNSTPSLQVGVFNYPNLSVVGNSDSKYPLLTIYWYWSHWCHQIFSLI